MRNFKLIFVILGLLSSFVTMGADNSITNNNGNPTLVGATFKARIISPKGIVYADENMLSPMGYIATGKAIVVGNPRRMNRDLVPLVINGRLAFIEIKDIRYEGADEDDFSIKRGAPREHNFDIMLPKPEERLGENNSMFFTLHSYGAGDETKQAFSTIDQSEEDTFGGFQAQFIHRQSKSSFFWGAGIDYSSMSSANMKFGYWMITPTAGFTPMRTSLFLIDLYASLDIAVNTELEIDSNFENEPSGTVWGAQANARIVLFPDSKYHIVGGVGLRKYSVSGLSELKDAAGTSVEGIQNITGASVFIGLGMEFK